MISFLLIMFCVFCFVKLLSLSDKTIQSNPLNKVNCPPHLWTWERVYNDDGSVHHQHLVCKKCGPLHGEKDE